MDTKMNGIHNNLEIHTFGKFLVRNNLATISEKTERSNKTWELFKFLLTNRGKLLVPEKIIEMLWPQWEYANPRASFRYHVYRMRQFLRSACVSEKAVSIVYTNGCYSLETDCDCWLDAEEFVNLSRKADRLSRNNLAEAIKTYSDALSLYIGPYLPEVTGSWVIPARNYYRNLYLKNIFKVSSLLKKAGRLDQIIEICEKAFLIEPAEEDLHLLYINTLLKKGKTERARAHYEQITTTMYQEAGIKPSWNFRNAYRKIKKSYEAGIINYPEVQEIRKKREKAKGALICSPEFFRFLCELERRRSERSGGNIYVGVFSLHSPDGRVPPLGELQDSLKSLQEVLLNNLRKGDVISQCSKNQFVLLLIGMELGLVEKNFERIREKFEKIHSKKEVVLSCNVHSLFSFLE